MIHSDDVIRRAGRRGGLGRSVEDRLGQRVVVVNLQIDLSGDARPTRGQRRRKLEREEPGAAQLNAKPTDKL